MSQRDDAKLMTEMAEALDAAWEIIGPRKKPITTAARGKIGLVMAKLEERDATA